MEDLFRSCERLLPTRLPLNDSAGWNTNNIVTFLYLSFIYVSMEKFWNKMIADVKQSRDKKLAPFAKLCLKLGITANIMTAISFIFGLAAVYYLFQNHLLFFIFALIHWLADGFDGVIAKLSKPTKFGHYFDHVINDRLIELLIVIKIGWVFNEYYAYIIAVLYIIAQTIHIVSKFRAPILYSRSFILLFAALKLPTLAYLTMGVASLYSLARQLVYWLEMRR